MERQPQSPTPERQHEVQYPFELPTARMMREMLERHIRESVDANPAYKTEEFNSQLAGKVEAFRSFEDETDGGRESHRALASYLLSDELVEGIRSIHHFAEKTGNDEMVTQAAHALVAIDEAMNTLDRYAESKSLPGGAGEAFSEMQRRTLDGSMGWSNFLSMVRVARRLSLDTIIQYSDAITDETAGPDFAQRFQEVSQEAVQREKEAYNGLEFPGEFSAEVMQEGTKALVLSLDFNSTWNRYESYPNPHLTGRAIAEIEALAHDFQRQYPDKQLYVVINTGRPALYAWGVLEAIKSHSSLRHFALAESGGTVLTEMHDGEREVAVPDSERWQQQLDKLKNQLLENIQTTGVTIEPKMSMLSMQLANKPERGGNFLHTSTEGETVHEEWIRKQVENFFITEEQKLRKKITAYRGEVALGEEAAEDLEALFETVENGEKQNFQEVEEAFDGIISVFSEERKAALESLRNDLQALAYLQENLLIDYNETAGFVDIGHKALNKYSTLKNELGRRGIGVDESVIVHIGDSSSDCFPFEETGAGQVNEGADRTWAVGVGNSNGRMRDNVSRRQEQFGRGIMASRDSSLALIDMIKGIRSAIKQ